MRKVQGQEGVRVQAVRNGAEKVQELLDIPQLARAVVPVLRIKDAHQATERAAQKRRGGTVLSWFNFNKYVTGRCRRCGAPRIRAMCQECGTG